MDVVLAVAAIADTCTGGLAAAADEGRPSRRSSRLVAIRAAMPRYRNGSTNFLADTRWRVGSWPSVEAHAPLTQLSAAQTLNPAMPPARGSLRAAVPGQRSAPTVGSAAY